MSNLTNNYRKYIAAAAAICLAMSAAGCSKSDSSSETDAKTASAQISSEAFEISAEDKDIGYDETEAVKIALSGESAEIEGSGAACENGVLSITDGGTYILSGDLSGEIYVKAKDSEVKLVLNGVSVTNSDYAALMIDKASKVTLTLEDGTENSFADGAEYTLTYSNDNTDGCIFSRADLTINGSGSLSVTGSYKHGIVSKDNIVIAGGNITVNAASGGIYGKDSVKISSGTIDVTAGSNGIRATNDEDAEKGFVSVTGGDITVNAAGDALEAETVMQIEDGTLTLTSGGGAANASMKSDGQPNGDWGSWSKDDMGTPRHERSADGYAARNAVGQRRQHFDGYGLHRSYGRQFKYLLDRRIVCRQRVHIGEGHKGGQRAKHTGRRYQHRLLRRFAALERHSEHLGGRHYGKFGRRRHARRRRHHDLGRQDHSFKKLRGS